METPNARFRSRFITVGPFVSLLSVQRLAGIFRLSLAGLMLLGSPFIGRADSVKKVLFFDDEDVLYRSGTKRLLHPLTKYSGTVIANTESNRALIRGSYERWESQVGFCSAVYDPSAPTNLTNDYVNKRFKIWYQAYANSKSWDKAYWSVVCLAVSDDGLTWIKPGINSPGLGIVNFNNDLCTLGSTTNIGGTNYYKSGANYFPIVETSGTLCRMSPPYLVTTGTGSHSINTAGTNYGNNIVLIGSGGYGDRFTVSVVRDTNDADTNRRYKMLYYDFSNTNASLVAPYTNGNHSPTAPSEPTGGGMQAAFSSDGVHWTKYTAPAAPGYPGPAVLSQGSYGDSGLSLPIAATNTLKPATNEIYKPAAGSSAWWKLNYTMSDGFDMFYNPPKTNGTNVTAGQFEVYGKMWVDGPAPLEWMTATGTSLGQKTWKHALGRSTSTNFTDWTTPELLLTTDERDPTTVEFHTSPVFCLDGMYLSLNELWSHPTDGTPDSIDIELMSSRDARHWTRFRKEDYGGVEILPRLDASEDNSSDFDTGSIFTNSDPIVVGDTDGVAGDNPSIPENSVRFYYGAYGNGTGTYSHGTGVGMAWIKQDRMVGLSAISPSGTAVGSPLVGQVTLKANTFTSGTGTLRINATVASGGELNVELLDPKGYRVPSYTKADSNTITPSTTGVTGDPLNYAVTWGSGTSAKTTIPAGNYLIRLYVKNAEIFSCSIRP